MASAAAAINAAAGSKPLPESLWWDSFVLLLEELDRAPLSDDLPDHLVEKVKSNHAWFLDSVACFKPPNEASRLSLDFPEIAIGSRRLVVKPNLKEAALRISNFLFLDEVQSYILAHRSSDFNYSDADIRGQEFLDLILLQYYLERQCLLKCIRRIVVHALYASDVSHSNEAVRALAMQLVRDGLQQRLLSICKDLLSSVFSEKAEVELIVLWVEETLIENNLVLDILFLAYHDNFCTCNGEQWKTLCSFFKDMLSGPLRIEKLAVSARARNSFGHVKAQLLLILIETLDLENLLQMVHDEVPFRLGYSGFSLSDIQEMDAEISNFSDLGTKEAGPLVLAWATFLCLLMSLPETSSMLIEIDHIGYARQAFEASPFSYLVDILRSDALRDSDGPVSGFLSVLRTFISAFIASYELSNQTEDNPLDMILDVLCEIYNGEEPLAIQFWDRDSFVDVPIRSFLYLLEREYPFQTVKFVRFLSAVCEGAWPAGCVYNYLDNISGITMLFEVPAGSNFVNVYDAIESQHEVCIPGVQGLVIPRGTYGHVLKIIDENVVLVRWECPHSGVALLLMRLMEEFISYNYEEVFQTVNLLCRMIRFNKALCFALIHIEKVLSIQASSGSRQIEKIVGVDVVKIVCTLIFNLVQDVSNSAVASMCFNLLAEMLKCLPTHVIDVVLKSNIVAADSNGASSGAWLLSGGLARMLLADCGQNRECFPLTTSVLDFTIQLVENGAEYIIVSGLVIFSLQYVFVDHMFWKYQLKYGRWKVTLKVLEVMKSCSKAIRFSNKLGCMIRDILLNDSSIHNMLCQVICMSKQALEFQCLNFSYDCELREIETLQLAVCSAFDIVHSILADLLQFQETFSNAQALVQTMLSSTAKPMSAVTSAVSLISFFHNSEIQVAAARFLSIFCFAAVKFQSYSMENLSLVADTVQIRVLNSAICRILDEEVDKNEDLIIATFNLLNSIARYQPALFVSMMSKEGATSHAANDRNNQLAVAQSSDPLSSKNASPTNLIMKYVERSENLLNSAPRLLLSFLNLLKAFWEGGSQYAHILEKFRCSKIIWEHLSSCVSVIRDKNVLSMKNQNHEEMESQAFRYRCQGTILEIITHEMFLLEKLSQDEIQEKQSCSTSNGLQKSRLIGEISKSSNESYLLDVLSSWCEGSIMDKLMKSYSSSGYDKEVIFHAKVAVCLCIVHLIDKLSNNNAGSLSLPIVEKIHTISTKLTAHPAFYSLLSRYTSHGYSEGNELTNLIIRDLYFHLQGELEGRKITSGPFQELSHFLLDLEIFEFDARRHGLDLWPPKDFCMFDIAHIREEFKIELWDHSDWKASKEIAERMFLHMHHANKIMFTANSKHFALRTLVAVISVYKIANTTAALPGGGIPMPLVESGIRYGCKCFQETIDSLVPVLNPPEDLLGFLATQTELLVILSRILYGQLSQRTNSAQFFSVAVLIIKTSGSGIKFLTDVQLETTVLNNTVKLILLLLLTSVEFIYPKSYAQDKTDVEVKLFAEASLASVGLLPFLCKYSEYNQYSDLSMASIDLILKGFLSPPTWLPILQKHLQLQPIVQKIGKKDALASVPVILNFLLTLGHTKDGAKMLRSANLFSSLKMLFGQFFDRQLFSKAMDRSGFTNIFSETEEYVHLWGPGLAVVASMIYSLGDDSNCFDVVESAVRYFFSEKSYIMSCYLSAPTFSANDHTTKRARIQKPCTSLSALRLTEHALMLICVLAKYRASWSKGIKEMDSELRETIVHLLAFISRGFQCIGDSHTKASPLFCPPTSKEEVELNKKPSFVKSKHGWFMLSTVGFVENIKLPASSTDRLSLVTEDADLVQRTHFSDIVAIQVYRISFLLLKFLCMQAKEASKRAEELEFIDLAHFPELPTPEILHGLQDQTIAIVTEVCEANRSRPIQPEIENLCLLLLRILEKSLYLELCVSQSCRIRPVLGRVEDFSKEIKVLIQAIEQQTNLKVSLRSLRKIIAHVYPGLLKTSNLI